MSAPEQNVSSDASAGVPSPAALFQGYNSLTGGGLSTALTGKTAKKNGTSGVKYRVCTDIETLTQSLDIDQSLSVGFGPFGSVDEKFKFVRNLNVTTNSVSIVVHARHFEGTEVATNVALADGVSPPSSPKELANFARAYGDAYVAEITRGGEYYAVYVYYSQTREEQTDLTLEMKAQGIFEVATVDASLQVKLKEFNKKTKTRIFFDQKMSGHANPTFPSSDDIIAYALKFPSLPLDAPAIIGFQTTGYEHVPKIGDFQPVADNRDFFIGDGIVDGLTKPLVQLQQLENQIAWIGAVYTTYGFTGDAKLDTVREMAAADHRTINKMFQDYKTDPTRSFTEPKLPSLSEGTPVLQYSVKHSDAYGGNRGTPFDDVNPNTSIPQQTRIAGLQLWSEKIARGLTVDYENVNGKWTVTHGEKAGNVGGHIVLQAGQFVTQISVRSGESVDRLTLTTSNGDKVDGGGNGGAGPFTVPVPEKSFLLGFAGRSGADLDNIQFVFGSLSPATWRAR